MFKFALALGIAFEWLVGPGVSTPIALAYAALRALCATLLAWTMLEAVRTLFVGAMSLDDTPPPVPQPARPAPQPPRRAGAR